MIVYDLDYLFLNVIHFLEKAHLILSLQFGINFPFLIIKMIISLGNSLL